MANPILWVLACIHTYIKDTYTHTHMHLPMFHGKPCIMHASMYTHKHSYTNKDTYTHTHMHAPMFDGKPYTMRTSMYTHIH